MAEDDDGCEGICSECGEPRYHGDDGCHPGVCCGCDWKRWERRGKFRRALASARRRFREALDRMAKR